MPVLEKEQEFDVFSVVKVSLNRNILVLEFLMDRILDNSFLLIRFFDNDQ